MSAERETCDYEARSFVLAQKDQPLKKENIRAFSHTHPKSVSNGDFGSEDFDHFKQVKKRIDFITFYLMNPFQELRYAKEAKDFLRGKDLAWVKGITE